MERFHPFFNRVEVSKLCLTKPPNFGASNFGDVLIAQKLGLEIDFYRSWNLLLGLKWNFVLSPEVIEKYL